MSRRGGERRGAAPVRGRRGRPRATAIALLAAAASIVPVIDRRSDKAHAVPPEHATATPVLRLESIDAPPAGGRPPRVHGTPALRLVPFDPSAAGDARASAIHPALDDLARAIARAAGPLAPRALVARAASDGRAILVHALTAADAAAASILVRPAWWSRRHEIVVPGATRARFCGPRHVLVEHERAAAGVGTGAVHGGDGRKVGTADARATTIDADADAATVVVRRVIDLDDPARPLAPPAVALHTLVTARGGAWAALDVHGDVRHGSSLRGLDAQDAAGGVLLRGPATAVALSPDGRWLVAHVEVGTAATSLAATLDAHRAAEGGDDEGRPRRAVPPIAAAARVIGPGPAIVLVDVTDGRVVDAHPATALRGGVGLDARWAGAPAWGVLGAEGGPPDEALFVIGPGARLHRTPWAALDDHRIVTVAPGGAHALARPRRRDPATGGFPPCTVPGPVATPVPDRAVGPAAPAPTAGRLLGGPPVWLVPPHRATTSRARSDRALPETRAPIDRTDGR